MTLLSLTKRVIFPLKFLFRVCTDGTEKEMKWRAPQKKLDPLDLLVQVLELAQKFSDINRERIWHYWEILLCRIYFFSGNFAKGKYLFYTLKIYTFCFFTLQRFFSSGLNSTPFISQGLSFLGEKRFSFFIFEKKTWKMRKWEWEASEPCFCFDCCCCCRWQRSHELANETRKDPFLSLHAL